MGLSEKHIREIVEKHTECNVLGLKKVENRGNVNDVYTVTADISKYIFRVDQSETSLARFQKEKWCMSEAGKYGVKVPGVVAIGMIDTHPYMLLQYIDGIDGDKTIGDRRSELWATLGDYARRIHAIPVKGWGEKMTAPGVFDGSWDAFLDYNILSLTNDDELRKRDIMTNEESSQLEDIFARLRNTTFSFGLIHNDISLNNTRVTPEGTAYLLDWGSAEVNIIPHMEISEILQSSLEETSDHFKLFLAHYGLSYDAVHEMKPDMNMLRVLICTDKIRWAIDRRPERIDEKIDAFRSALTAVSELIP